jgi:hypothetical protein
MVVFSEQVFYQAVTVAVPALSASCLFAAKVPVGDFKGRFWLNLALLLLTNSTDDFSSIWCPPLQVFVLYSFAANVPAGRYEGSGFC